MRKVECLKDKMFDRYMHNKAKAPTNKSDICDQNILVNQQIRFLSKYAFVNNKYGLCCYNISVNQQVFFCDQNNWVNQ